VKPDDDKTPECTLDMHQLCPGPKEIRLESAPHWGPILTLRCNCPCHRKKH
jgi:hypothetical protein